MAKDKCTGILKWNTKQNQRIDARYDFETWKELPPSREGSYALGRQVIYDNSKCSGLGQVDSEGQKGHPGHCQAERYKKIKGITQFPLEWISGNNVYRRHPEFCQQKNKNTGSQRHRKEKGLWWGIDLDFLDEHEKILGSIEERRGVCWKLCMPSLPGIEILRTRMQELILRREAKRVVCRAKG